MSDESIIKGKREVVRLNSHEVTVIIPDKLIPYEEGREKLRQLLLANK